MHMSISMGMCFFVLANFHYLEKIEGVKYDESYHHSSKIIKTGVSRKWLVKGRDIYV